MTSQIILGRSEEGYVAASLASPYFCFVADTEEAAIAKAQAAVDFYAEHVAETPSPAARSVRISNLAAPRKVVLEHHMAVA